MIFLLSMEKCILCNKYTIAYNEGKQPAHDICMSQYTKDVMMNIRRGCSMCGKDRKLVLDSNTCNSCLKSSFD